MKKLIALFAFAVAIAMQAIAQTTPTPFPSNPVEGPATPVPAPVPAPTSAHTLGTPDLSTLPSNWIGGGAAYNQYSSPKTSGWVSYAHYMGSGVYSFTSEDVTAVGKPFTLQTSARTGIATVIKQIGPVYLLAFGDAGAAVSSPVVPSVQALARKHSVDISAAFGPGGMLVYRKGKFTVEAAYRKLVTIGQGSQNVYEAGIGYTF